MVLGERGLRIESIDVGRPAIHEKMNDPLGLGREMRRLGEERVERLLRVGAQSERLGENTPERHRPHPHSAPLQEIATGKEKMFEAWRMMRHAMKDYPRITFREEET